MTKSRQADGMSCFSGSREEKCHSGYRKLFQQMLAEHWLKRRGYLVPRCQIPRNRARYIRSLSQPPNRQPQISQLDESAISKAIFCFLPEDAYDSGDFRRDLERLKYSTFWMRNLNVCLERMSHSISAYVRHCNIR